MPKPTPATIEYITDDETSFESITAETATEEDFETFETNNVVRFHAVVSEDHGASSVITKFPIQNGFEVSNHAIIRNRTIKLQVMFSNTLLEGTDQVNYSSNNSKTLFTALSNLVRSAKVCKVTTNLGIYEPVVFKKFSTVQQKGMVDSIMVTMEGEELQVASNLTKAAPTKLTFVEVPVEERQSYIDKLTEAGIGTDLFGESIFTDATKILTSTVEVGSDFIMESITSAGEIFDVTMIADAWDGISDFTYSVFTDNLSVFTDPADYLTGLVKDLNIPLLPSAIDLIGGFNGVTNCLLGGSSSIIQTEIEKTIDTAMGKLDRAVYGAKQDIIKLGGNDMIQSLIGTGLDCIALGASKTFGGEATSVDEAVDEIIVAVKGIGDAGTRTLGKVVDGAVKEVREIIKIESPVELPLQTKGRTE